jgi:hypothetical protein
MAQIEVMLRCLTVLPRAQMNKPESALVCEQFLDTLSRGFGAVLAKHSKTPQDELNDTKLSHKP